MIDYVKLQSSKVDQFIHPPEPDLEGFECAALLDPACQRSSFAAKTNKEILLILECSSFSAIKFAAQACSNKCKLRKYCEVEHKKRKHTIKITERLVFCLHKIYTYSIN